MAGILLFQAGGAGTLNSAGAQHPAPVTVEEDLICRLSLPGVVTATYRWVLTKPGGSASVLSSTTSAGPSFLPDVEAGSYSVSCFDINENEYVLDIVTPTSGVGPPAGGTSLPTILDTYGSVRAANAFGSTPPAVILVQCREDVDDGGGGSFAYDASDTTTADDDGTVLVSAEGFRFRRIYSGALNIRWFGAGKQVAADDTAALNAILAIIAADEDGLLSRQIFFPWVENGYYNINEEIVIQGGIGQSIELLGESIGSASANAVQLYYTGPQTDGAFITFNGGQGIRVRNLRFNAGAPGQAGAKYCVWLKTDQVAPVGLTDAVFYDCVFTGCRNLSTGALVALGPASGSPAQCDTIRFYNCTFNGQFGGSAAHSGVLPLVAGNTKFFQFFGCTFAYNRFAVDLVNLGGPASFHGCGFANNIGAAFRLGQNARVVLDGCYGEGDNMIIDTNGIGAASGSVSLNNCEWHISGSYAALDGSRNYGIIFYGGWVYLNGSYFQIESVPSITGATNATPIVITSVGHTLVTGDRIEMWNVGGNTAANGHWRVTKLTADTFSLQDEETGANVAGSGAWTSGGTYSPAFKIRVLDIAGNTTHLSGVTAQNSAFFGSGKYPSVVDSAGNYLFDTTFSAAQTVRPNAVLVDCCGVDGATGNNAHRMRNIGHVEQVSSGGTQLPRRPVLNLIGASVADNPTTNSTDLTLMLRAGAGSPEGVVTAPVGTEYRRTDGGASTTLYVKESGAGNTGWKAMQPVLAAATANVSQRNHPWFADPTQWAIDEHGRVICNTAAGDAAYFSLELPEGEFDSVTVYVIGGGNANLPAAMPRIRVRTLRIDTEAVTATSATLDGSLDVGSYNAVHAISIGSLGLTVNNDNTRYTVEFTSESGANAVTGYKILGILCGVDVTTADRRAS